MAPLSNIQAVDVDYALKKRKEQNQLDASSLYEGGLDGASYKLREEQSSLLHDFDIVSQIAGLVSALKLQYKVLDDNKVRKWCQYLQSRMVNVDKKVINQEGARLDLVVPTPKSSETLCTFLMQSPEAKEKLMTGIQIALLKQSKRNNPGWLSTDSDDATDMFSESGAKPLFLTNINACPSTTNVSMCCGAVSLVTAPAVLGTSGPCVWVCGVNQNGCGFVSIISDNKPLPRVLECFSSCSSEPLCITSVLLEAIGGGLYPTMWIGTRAGNLLLFDAKLSSAERKLLFHIKCPESVRSIICCTDKVFVGLGSGTLIALSVKYMSNKVNTVPGGLSPYSAFREDTRMELKFQQAVNCMEVVGDQVWCATGCSIRIVDGKSVTVEDSIEVDSTGQVAICTMARVGAGLWLALSNSPTVQLYHTETRQFLQEVSIDGTIRRLDPELFRPKKLRVSARQASLRSSTCNVTCLLAAHGHLTVGTSCGHLVALPVARLEGVPLSSGKAAMSVHHYDRSAVRFLVCTSDVVPIKGSPQKKSNQAFLSTISFQRNASGSYIDFRSLKGRIAAMKELEEEKGKVVAEKVETTDGRQDDICGSESKKVDYDPPWDKIASNRKKSPGFAFELKYEEELGGMDSITQSISIEQAEAETSQTEKHHGLLLAGGEGYKWSDKVADDAQILVWRIDY
jgi:Rho guanine nucleotide exchange factor 10